MLVPCCARHRTALCRAVVCSAVLRCVAWRCASRCVVVSGRAVFCRVLVFAMQCRPGCAVLCSWFVLVLGYRGAGDKPESDHIQVDKLGTPTSYHIFKDALCQNVCTRHGLQEMWVSCVLHAVRIRNIEMRRGVN